MLVEKYLQLAANSRYGGEHMEAVRYEPLGPTIMYQRSTREGQYILYFVPADVEQSHAPGDRRLLPSSETPLPYSRLPASAR